MKRLIANPYLLLALTSLFWAGNMVMSRGLRADLPPVGLAFWRWVVAFLCVLPQLLHGNDTVRQCLTYGAIYDPVGAAADHIENLEGPNCHGASPRH